MEAKKENEIIVKAIIEEKTELKNGTKSHNPGLRALLAIKNFNATLEKDYSELLQIENNLNELNQKGSSLIETSTSPEIAAQWNGVLEKVKVAITGINDTLTSAKEKIEQKTNEGYIELWKQLSLYILALKENSKKTADIGFQLLPEPVHSQWEKEFVNLEISMMELMVKHVESCRVLLQMIERYTPDELNSITKIIVEKIPLDFSYQEAVEYQNDYYKALVNFKNEFKEEKNLWDKFLDILAGGTHQLPSERVMMERWLNGEKEDL
jgi:hypothetical protein